MADTENPVEHPGQARAGKRRRTAPRRKAASRKSPARRKKTSARSRSAAPARRLAALLDGLAKRAETAGKGLRALSGQGTDAARRALLEAGATSRKTIARLTKQWERMDTRRRAQWIAALLAALAAASAPIVRGRLKK